MIDEPRESDAHAVPPVTEAETDMASVRPLRPFGGGIGLSADTVESIAGRSRHDELVAEIEDLRLSAEEERSGAEVLREELRKREATICRLEAFAVELVDGLTTIWAHACAAGSVPRGRVRTAVLTALAEAPTLPAGEDDT